MGSALLFMFRPILLLYSAGSEVNRVQVVLSGLIMRFTIMRCTNNILYDYQFGFRPGHSTQQAIITLIDKITKSLDNGDIVISLLIDLKKAFDTVDPSPEALCLWHQRHHVKMD